MKTLFSLCSLTVACAISASAGSRVQPLTTLPTPSQHFKSVAAHSSQRAPQTASVDINDIAGEYDITCDWLLQGGMGNITVNIEVIDDVAGEVLIKGWPQGFEITAYVDTESSTMYLSNNQYLGEDSDGDVNYFYIKDIIDNTIMAGMSNVSDTEGTIDGTTITFPFSEAWAIGNPSREEAGFLYLATNVKLTKYVVPDNPNEGWTSLGYATLQEGWTLPVFIVDQTIRSNWYEVELQQNDENPNKYRLVDPYHGGYPAQYANQCNRTGYIQFDVTDPDHVVFDLVPAGFTFSPLGISQLYCYNQLTYRMVSGNKTAREVIDEIGDEIPYTTFKDGVITLSSNDNYTDACFGVSGALDAGMYWVDQDGNVPVMETKIFFPGCVPGTEGLYDGWHDVGMAKFQDGWYIPLLSMDQTKEEYHYDVQLQQNDSNPCKYRLVDPFHGNNPAAPYNSSNDFGYIVFDITDPDHVVFDAVSAGMAIKAMGVTEFYCYNRLTHVMLTTGKSIDEIITDRKYAGILYSTFKDNVLTVPSKALSTGGYNNDARFGYQGALNVGEQWEIADGVYTNMEAKIFFPEDYSVSTPTVGVNHADAPVEYYNLQGIRIAGPAAGQVTIRRQGTNVTKILIP